MINVSIPGRVSAMFVRSKTVKGRTYYQVVETRRTEEDGRVRYRQRTLASLGTHPTIADALRESEARYFASRKGRTRAPFTDAEQDLWHRIRHLDYLLTIELKGHHESSAAFEAELRRRNRTARKKEREEDKREQDRFFDEAFGATRARLDPSDYVTLGLHPPPTIEEIKAAYRKKAREYHPDHGGSDEAMAAVNEAYERLLANEARERF